MMIIIFYILLVLKFGRCTDDRLFETKTAAVGQNVTLSCARDTMWRRTNLYWIRVVSGTFPEFLGGTLSYEFGFPVKTRHITAKQEPGKFVLHIQETQLSDTAVYYCIKTKSLKMTFVNGVFLRVKGPETDVTAITEDSLSDPVHPGDPVNLQCSVLSNSGDKSCLEDHSVFWFRAGSDESHPSLIYTHGNRGDECEESLEAQAPRKCLYSFSKNVSSSDAGTYYCAVATCGEILFGNGTKLDVEVSDISIVDSQKDNIIIPLLCGVLAVSLIVIVVLVWAIRSKSCDCCNDVTVQTNSATATGDLQRQQENENTLVYSTAVFTRRKSGKLGRRSATNEETTYTDVRAFVID